jgi:hypothetical protein
MPDVATSQLYEFGCTISAKNETKDVVIRVISAAEHDRYAAAAKDQNWAENNLPNVRGLYPRSPSPRVYWVRPIHQEQADV